MALTVCVLLPWLQHVAVSSGMQAADLSRLKEIIEAVPELSFICLDVANGYSEHFVAFVKEVRKEFSDQTIMVCDSGYLLSVTNIYCNCPCCSDSFRMLLITNLSSTEISVN